MRNIKILVFVLLLIPFRLFAYTHIDNSHINSNQSGRIILDKDNSPYILDEYITIPKNKTLYIGSGVTIMVSSSTLATGDNGIDVIGEMIVDGSADNVVNLIDVGNLYVLNSTTTIKNSILSNTYIESVKSNIELYDVEIKNNKYGVSLSKSKFTALNTTFENNQTAVVSNMYKPIYQVQRNEDGSIAGIGGIGNALDLDQINNIVTIKDSQFLNNKISIDNKSPNIIYATENWWGDESGPGNTIIGLVDFDPWKKEKPVKDGTCCSSVLFLPGIEASRLYVEDPLYFGTSTNQVWEPNRNDDIRRLYYDNNFKPIDKNIYTKDPIDKIHGLKGVYGNIITMFNSMVADKKISEWLPFAYDWREDVYGIVDNGTKYSSSTKYISDEMVRLAKYSKTGKVSIVAHSNGGLLLKAIYKRLYDVGKSDLIDKVILIAVPELGTPESITSMLYGVGKKILGIDIMSSEVTRRLANYIPGVYGLLPSKEFFNNFNKPIIKFIDKNISGVDYGSYGEGISSYNDMVSFLTANKDGRKKPSESETKKPEILSLDLIKRSDQIHNELDKWSFPSYTKVLSIIGWGSPTTESIEYSNDGVYNIQTIDGDGTVLSASASNGKNQKVYFNQIKYKENTKKNISHSDITEADSVRKVVYDAITSTSTTTDMINDNLPESITFSKPEIKDYPNISFIKIGIHSPVDIDIYDEYGNHMGIIPNPKYPKDGIPLLDNSLGADYYEYGEEKFVTLSGDRKYDIKLKGTGIGSFTFDLKKYSADMLVVASSTYKDLPVTQTLLASTTISASNINPSLSLDFDGNGYIDTQVKPNDKFDPYVHIESLKTIIKSFNLDKKVEDRYIKKLNNIKSMLDKKKDYKKIEKRIKTIFLNNKRGHYTINKLSSSQKELFIKMLEEFIENTD